MRKRCQQQAQALHLHRRDDPVHNLVEVPDGQQLAAGHITELRMSCEEDRRRELGSQVVGQVELHVEAAQIARLLLVDLIDLPVRKYLPARCLLNVRQRKKALGQQASLANLAGAHVREAPPGHARGQLDTNPGLDRLLAPRHRNAGHGWSERS